MARAGHQVVGVDVRESVVERLRNGDIHIADEDGLVEVAQTVLRSGALQVSTTPVEADAFIICVPTPVKETHGADHTSEHVVLTEMTQGLLEAAAVGEVDGASPTENVGAYGLPTVDLSYVQSAVESIAPFVRHGSIVILESTVPPGTTEQVVLPILERYG